MNELQIRASLVILIGLGVAFLFLLMVSLGNLYLWTVGRGGNQGVPNALGLVGPVVVAGVMAFRLRDLVAVARMAIAGLPIVTINENGFFDHRTMRIPIPWDKIAGVNHGSGGMFRNVSIVLVKRASLETYLAAPLRGDFLQDCVYQFSTFGLNVNEFQLDEVVARHAGSKRSLG